MTASKEQLASYLNEVFLTAQALPARNKALLAASSFMYAQRKKKAKLFEIIRLFSNKIMPDLVKDTNKIR